MESKEQENGHDNLGFNKDTANEKRVRISFKDSSHARSAQETKPTKKEDINNVNDEEAPVDLSCGIWRLRTNILGSKFSNLYVFSICVGLSSFFTIMVQSVLHVQLTSIERQFNIDNAKAGLFDTAARIGSLTTILFAGHFAKKVHIPVVVGLAGIFQGVILMIPAFIQFAQPYTLEVIDTENDVSNLTNHTNFGENGKYLCRANGSHLAKENETTKDQTNNAAFVTIVVVQALKGVTDAFHSGFLPALYTDDNMLDKTRMGTFFVINSIISELANPIGKQINGFISNIPIDLKKTEMDPKDNRFVAAWWLAFLIFGVGTVVFSIPILLFPRKLVSRRQQEEALKKAMVSFTVGVTPEAEPSTDQQRVTDSEGNIQEKGGNHERSASQYRKQSLAPRTSGHSGASDVLNHMAMKRSSLLPPVQGPSERRISIDGTMIFDQPIKVKEVQNGTKESIQGSSSVKELLRDFPKAFVRIFRRPVFILIICDIIIASIPMAGTAIFRSSYIKYEYNVAMSEVAMLTGITQAVGQILGTFVSGWLASRVKTKMGYNYIIVGTYMISMCITPLYIIFGCGNEPIYGHTGSFGIPVNITETCGCAGTKQLISCGNDSLNYLSPCYAGCQNVKGKMFTMCSGLADYNMTHSVTLTPGLCATDCHDNFLLYVILHAVQFLLMSMGTIPRRLLILRMVDPQDRGFATSVFSFCSTLMAIPSPNLFGRIIDKTCLIWDGHTCSLYDRDQIRYFLSGLDIGVNVTIQVTMLLTIFFFRKEEMNLKRKLQEENQKDTPPETEVKT